VPIKPKPFAHKMKQLLLILILLFSLNSFGQNMHLKIIGKNENQTKLIDSIGYNKSFSNAKDVVDETKLFSEKLLKVGFLEEELLESKKENDSTFCTYIIQEQKRNLYIYI